MHIYSTEFFFLFQDSIDQSNFHLLVHTNLKNVKDTTYITYVESLFTVPVRQHRYRSYGGELEWATCFRRWVVVDILRR